MSAVDRNNIRYDSELTVLEISKGNRIMGVINLSPGPTQPLNDKRDDETHGEVMPQL